MGGWQLASVASTGQQYPELEVVSLSCTGSGSFWHWLYCSMSCFLELVPLCPSALLPDAEIVGQELNRYQHQQEGICSEIICTFKHKLS